MLELGAGTGSFEIMLPASLWEISNSPNLFLHSRRKGKFTADFLREFNLMDEAHRPKSFKYAAFQNLNPWNGLPRDLCFLVFKYNIDSSNSLIRYIATEPSSPFRESLRSQVQEGLLNTLILYLDHLTARANFQGHRWRHFNPVGYWTVHRSPEQQRRLQPHPRDLCHACHT